MLAEAGGDIEACRYNRVVGRYYTLDAANDLIGELAAIATRLRDQRAELVVVRDAYREREGELTGAMIARDAAGVPDARDDDDPELRRLRLRMRGIVDQMQADVAWLDDRSIVLRDISTGLLDFPALAGGRPVWLCWRLGEEEIVSWHGQEEGFAGRRSLLDLPDGGARA